MNLSDIDIRLLRVFHAVVKAEGFHNAQTTLNVSASTISTHMNQLEGRIGFKLCERGRGGFSLTVKGQLFYRHVLEFFGAMHSLEARARQLQKADDGHISLGIIDNLATDEQCPLHNALDAFYQEHSDASGARLSIQVLSPVDIEKGLLEQTLDIGIGIFYRQHPDLNYSPLYRERDVLVCQADHRLATVDDPRELADALASEQKVVRHFMQQQEFPFIQENDHSVIASVSNVEEVALMILHGPFIGFLPRHFAARWIDSGKLVALFPNKFVRHSQIFLVQSKSSENPPRLLLDFLSCLQNGHEDTFPHQ